MIISYRQTFDASRLKFVLYNLAILPESLQVPVRIGTLMESEQMTAAEGSHGWPNEAQSLLGGMQMSASLSPVTGVIDEGLVILDFGKYEGRSVKDIAELDPEFYGRLVSEKENGVFAIRRHRDKTFRLYINPLSNMDH